MKKAIIVNLEKITFDNIKKYYVIKMIDEDKFLILLL